MFLPKILLSQHNIELYEVGGTLGMGFSAEILNPHPANTTERERACALGPLCSPPSQETITGKACRTDHGSEEKFKMSETAVSE